MERGISLTRVCRSKCTIQAVRSLRSGSDDTFNAADWRVRHHYLEHLKSPHRWLEGLIHELTYQGRDNCCNPSEGDDSHKSKENTGSTLNEHTQGNEYWSYYPRCNGVDAPPKRLRKKNRRANMKHAAVSERNATKKPTPCSIAWPLRADGTSTGVPGGKPSAGSGTKIPAVIIPNP
jgi:hypothetical protein